MVSEAASSGKTVVVMRIVRRYNKRLKQERSMEELERLGYIVTTTAANLFHTVTSSWPPKTKPKILGDTAVAAKALDRLLVSAASEPIFV